MPSRERGPVGVWAVLVTLTALSWALAATGHGSARLVDTGAVLTIAFLKVRLVGLDFMTLRNAPRSLRLLFEGYVVAVWILLVVLCVAA